jgi:glycosyltransferase involved in cell wall biosynthesis
LTQPQTGVARALNYAWTESRGRFIARMDADDVAVPDRLAVQAEFLRQTPSVGVCGSWFRTFGAAPGGVVKVPVSDSAIRARLVFGSAFAHPAVMMRREVAEMVEGPYDAAAVAEDYELWLRLAEHTRFRNLPKVPSQLTQRAGPRNVDYDRHLRLRLLQRHGIGLTEREAVAHAATAVVGGGDLISSNADVEAWLARLVVELVRANWCGAFDLRHECAEAWWRVCSQRGRGPGASLAFWRSPLNPRNARSAWRALRLALRR